jgi:uncharacterized damage-inducible protein DinB
MLTQTLKTLFSRELEKLKKEIELYKDESRLWLIDKGIANSGGNLCLHLIGNLNTYIGKELGGTGYVRNRDLEFSQKNISRKELIQMIDNTILIVEKTLTNLNNQQLDEDYPAPVFDYEMTTGFFLVHLLAHLTYHLGQINYHRRLLDF